MDFDMYALHNATAAAVNQLQTRVAALEGENVSLRNDIDTLGESLARTIALINKAIDNISGKQK